MELSELKALVKVVQAGSFTRAAERLGSQKAQVSRQVAALERRLGARLIERTTRALSLTEIGRDVYERAVGILAALDDVERAAQSARAEPSGVLRITCGVEFGQLEVQGWVHGYLARYPQMQVEADFTSRVVDLVHEGIDLAIRVGRLPDSGLVARRLGDLHYGLFASPAYLARHGAPAQPDDLARHELLVFNAGSQRLVWHLHRAAAAQAVGTQGRSRLRINNRFALLDACECGLGIALLPQRVAQGALARATLVPVLAEWAPPPVPVNAVYASAHYLAPKVRAFIDHAVARFQAADAHRPPA